MRFPHLVTAVAVGAIALAACGGGGSSYSSSATPSSPTTQAASSTTVTPAMTALGNVLVDANGLTLYGLTKDVNGTPTCSGACATAWPPLTVSGATLPAGLDAKVFSVVTRSDGSHQLKAGKWPLYRFSGDTAPGDTSGQGMAGFFVVTPSGALHKS